MRITMDKIFQGFTPDFTADEVENPGAGPWYHGFPWTVELVGLSGRAVTLTQNSKPGTSLGKMVEECHRKARYLTLGERVVRGVKGRGPGGHNLLAEISLRCPFPKEDRAFKILGISHFGGGRPQNRVSLCGVLPHQTK